MDTRLCFTCPELLIRLLNIRKQTNKQTKENTQLEAEEYVLFSGHTVVSTSNLTTCRLRLKSSINAARMSSVILSHSSSFRPSFLQPAREHNDTKFISKCSKFQSFLIILCNWSHWLHYFFILRRSTVLQASQECRRRAERRPTEWWQQRRRKWRTDEGSRSGIASTKVRNVRTKADQKQAVLSRS